MCLHSSFPVDNGSSLACLRSKGDHGNRKCPLPFPGGHCRRTDFKTDICKAAAQAKAAAEAKAGAEAKTKAEKAAAEKAAADAKVVLLTNVRPWLCVQ